MQHTGNAVANAYWEGELPAGFSRPDSGQEDVRYSPATAQMRRSRLLRLEA